MEAPDASAASTHLGFIGFGNMAQALAQGLVAFGALSGRPHLRLRAQLGQAVRQRRADRRDGLPAAPAR